MISMRGVSKSYFGQPPILSDVNLELKRGDFLYVVGGTGAGKSSLLRMIATEEAPTQGKFSLFGYTLGSMSGATLRAIRQSVGYIPQNVQLIPDLTVLDNIAISLSLAGRRVLSTDYKKKMEDLIERLGLAQKRKHLVKTLSGGEAQRVAVARALVRSPELLIADEPTGAQDRDFSWQVMELFMRLNSTGTTVIVATHDREIVRRVRKRCALLREGRLALEEDYACIY